MRMNMENNIKSKINREVNNFHQKNMVWPNELWVGLKEKLDLEEYFNYHESISFADGPVVLDKKSRLSIDGLKIRYKDMDSYFKMYYNPHY